MRVGAGKAQKTFNGARTAQVRVHSKSWSSVPMSVRRLLAAALLFAVLPLPAADEGFKALFNGKDLSGWDGDSRFWRVEDGALTGECTPENPVPGNTFCIWRG